LTQKSNEDLPLDPIEHEIIDPRAQLTDDIDKSLQNLKEKRNKINLDINNQKVLDYGSSAFGVTK